nr:Uncharacterised protein [Streptococcus thermophilus]
MTNPTPNDPANDDTFMNALRGVGDASLNAWSRLGDLAGEFSRNFRADRDADVDTGAHHTDDEELTHANTGLAEQLKAAIANAREAYQGAANDRDFRAATTSFASDAESIFRDFAGSVTRAADTARESAEADKTKAAFSSALDEIRETFNTAVGQVRTRAAESDVDIEGTVADARSRLEEMIGRVSNTFNGGNNASDIVEHEAEDTDDR